MRKFFEQVRLWGGGLGPEIGESGGGPGGSAGGPRGGPRGVPAGRRGGPRDPRGAPAGRRGLLRNGFFGVILTRGSAQFLKNPESGAEFRPFLGGGPPRRTPPPDPKSGPKSTPPRIRPLTSILGVRRASTIVLPGQLHTAPPCSFLRFLLKFNIETM